MSAVPRQLHLPPEGRPRWLCPPEAKLDLVYLGWGKRDFALHPIPVSRHPGWVYFLILRGNPTLELARDNLRCAAGQILILGPDCASGWSATHRAPVELLTWVWRTPPRCEPCVPPRDDLIEFASTTSLRRPLRKWHAECRGEVERLEAFTPQALEQWRLRMDVAIARSRKPSTCPPPHALRLELALRWMAQNLAAANPVARLCDYLQVSPITVHRLFRDHLGEAPATHHLRLRMERARQLLSEGRLSVKEVAFALGYRHPNDFSRAYKRWFGRSPKRSTQ